MDSHVERQMDKHMDTTGVPIQKLADSNADSHIQGPPTKLTSSLENTKAAASSKTVAELIYWLACVSRY